MNYVGSPLHFRSCCLEVWDSGGEIKVGRMITNAATESICPQCGTTRDTVVPLLSTSSPLCTRMQAICRFLHRWFPTLNHVGLVTRQLHPPISLHLYPHPVLPLLFFISSFFLSTVLFPYHITSALCLMFVSLVCPLDCATSGPSVFIAPRKTTLTILTTTTDPNLRMDPRIMTSR